MFLNSYWHYGNKLEWKWYKILWLKKKFPKSLGGKNLIIFWNVIAKKCWEFREWLNFLLCAIVSSLTEKENLLVVSELGAIYEIMCMAFCPMLITIPKIDTKTFIYKTLEDTQKAWLNIWSWRADSILKINKNTLGLSTEISKFVVRKLWVELKENVSQLSWCSRWIDRCGFPKPMGICRRKDTTHFQTAFRMESNGPYITCLQKKNEWWIKTGCFEVSTVSIFKSRRFPGYGKLTGLWKLTLKSI